MLTLMLLACYAVVGGAENGLQPANPDATPAARENIKFNLDDESLVAMKSSWADYFGTHYSRTPDGAGTTWNTVRSYGGTHMGIHLEKNPEAPARKGPFEGKEVRLSLSDFHARRGGKSAEELVPDLIEHGITAVYLANNIVRPSTEGFDKDRFYWVVQMIHERFPEADEHIVWQIGNEVVSGHFDPQGVWKALSPEERRKNPMKEDNFFGYDLTWKEEFYVNEYLAPAIEAIERAASDVYGNPRRIQIALGSMNPYNKPNLVFLKNVMERRFDSRQAPSLRGEDVWKHVDFLTVHYMTGSAQTMETLQQYYDQYVKAGKVEGLWITEDHGRAGRGPVTIVDRGLRFLAWAAQNDLSAAQTRLCWWGERERDPGGQGQDATTLLGEFFAGRRLHFCEQAVQNATAYLLCDGRDSRVRRVLLPVAPDRDESVHLDGIQIELPPSRSTQLWSVEAIQYFSTKPAEHFVPKVMSNNSGLNIARNRRVEEPCLVLLTCDD